MCIYAPRGGFKIQVIHYVNLFRAGTVFRRQNQILTYKERPRKDYNDRRSVVA